MAKDLIWTVPRYTEFLRLSYLTEFQRRVMDLHVVNHMKNYEIALYLEEDVGYIDSTLADLKEIYDAVQADSDILPERKHKKNKRK